MKTTVSCNRFVLLGLCVALFAAVTVAGARGDETPSPKQADSEWNDLSANDKAYLDEYNKLAEKKETFTGTLTSPGQVKEPNIVMRDEPYALDGVNVFTHKDLSAYVGKKVEIVGKKVTFELEGQTLTEIRPLKIRLMEAQEEQPQAVEHKEIPAKAVDGLLFEIKLLNTQPLLPGDTSFTVEYRFTNVQEKGDIQYLDNSGLFNSEYFRATMTGPDGKPIHFDERRLQLLEPKGPTCTLQGGNFYGGKIQVQVWEGLKPGKYLLSFGYWNETDLKNKGFSLWTGKAQSNTIVFEVLGADVKPVNGVQMFIKMKKDVYAENEPVMVEVRFVNAGDKEQEVYVPDDMLLQLYSRGTVTDGDGKVVQWNNIEAECLRPLVVHDI